MPANPWEPPRTVKTLWREEMKEHKARMNEGYAKATLTAIDRLVGNDDISQLPVEELPIERIKHNPTQPRRRQSDAFSEDSIKELADSISLHGVLQPILVKSIGRY